MFIFIWVMCAIIAAGIGSNKGMAGSGFLLGLIFGPIGIIIVLVSSGDKRVCPYCKEMVHKDAVRCPKCQKDLGQEKVAEKK